MVADPTDDALTGADEVGPHHARAEDPVDVHVGGGAAAAVAGAAGGGHQVGPTGHRAEDLGPVVVVAGEDHGGPVGREVVGELDLPAHRGAPPSRVVAVLGGVGRVVH